MPHSAEILATIIFAAAVVHTFVSGYFRRAAARFRSGSFFEKLLHLLGEVELVFALWAAVLIVVLALVPGMASAANYVAGLNFTEALFVFVIMVTAATRPVVEPARRLMAGLGRGLPLRGEMGFYLSCLIVGPLLGSFITEPAAMTVTALLLKERFYNRSPRLSSRFRYVTLAVLFVNVSVGGVLTHFAAPPVLMVASRWSWGTLYMFTHFGWKAAIAVVVNAVLAAFVLRQELVQLTPLGSVPKHPPQWIVALHLLFLTTMVIAGHHPAIFVGIFLFFLGLVSLTREHHDGLKLRESLVVALFLAGLIVLGDLQSWWLAPLIQNLKPTALYWGATALTAITDNAALTYLGSQVSGMGDDLRYALLSGAVTGGGLTVIANAPNPAGFSILQDAFGDEGISALKLFAAALVPTLICAAAFLILR